MTILLKVMTGHKLQDSSYCRCGARWSACNQSQHKAWRTFFINKIHLQELLVTFLVFTLLPSKTCATNDVARALVSLQSTANSTLNATLLGTIGEGDGFVKLDYHNATKDTSHNFNRSYNYSNLKIQLSDNSYTEDLEQTIRNAVKTEIENEQDIAVPSSRLFNNINDYSHVQVTHDITPENPAKENVTSDTENNEIEISASVPASIPILLPKVVKDQSIEAQTVHSNPINEEVSSNFSIELEETLKATESSVNSEPQIGTTMYDFDTEMLNKKNIFETTTEIFEETMHNVIKKQGVNPEDAFVIPDGVSEFEHNLDLLDFDNVTTFDLDETTLQPALVEFSTTKDSSVHTTEVFIEHMETTHRIPQEYDTNIQDDGQLVTHSTIAIKGSRSLSINSLDDNVAATLFESYTPQDVEQTLNAHLAAESFQEIEKISTTNGNGRSLLIVMVCGSSAVLFVAISVAMYLISFQRQHGTLDIEMQERHCGKDDEDLETCQKLLEIELPVSTIAIAEEMDQ